MSAIGGIADFKCDEVNFNSLNKMRLSMSLRGREGSSAFLCGGVGMFYNADTQRKDEKGRQPTVYERGGYTYAFCIDGASGSGIGEKYMLHGTEFLGLLRGAFALALYDAQRNMLLLARDKQGKKPLYYRRYKNKILFASEVKGILDGMDDMPSIDCNALEAHMLAPAGIYRATSIYPDICEVLAGECVIFTSVGMSKFFYREKHNAQLLKCSTSKEKRERIAEAFPAFSVDCLDEYLCNALIAFDYPQFDVFMPQLMEMLDRANMSGKTEICFNDGIRRRNLSYAYEREDRIGAFFGVGALGVLPKTQPTLDRECIDAAERWLCERLFSMSEEKTELLKDIFGEYKLYSIFKMLEQKSKKEEDTERKIRILGMLCQCPEWLSARPMLLQRYDADYGRAAYSALSTI